MGLVRFAAVMALLSTAGCASQMFRDPTTGKIETCELHGALPIINRANCIDRMEKMGWQKTDDDTEISRHKQTQATLDSLGVEYNACVGKLKSNPALQPLAHKIYLGNATEQGFEYLTNKERASEADKPSIRAFADAVTKCNEVARKGFDVSSYPESLVVVYKSAWDAGQNILANLYNGNLTYGDYAQLRKEVGTNRDTAIAQIKRTLEKDAQESRAIAAQIASQNQIAQAQRSQAISSSMMAGAAMANAFKPNPVYVQPTTRSMNCTSTPTGLGSVSTNCY